jgi:hypothetical protein
MDIKRLDEVPPFITKDGSEIRELLAYRFRCGVPLSASRRLGGKHG